MTDNELEILQLAAQYLTRDEFILRYRNVFKDQELTSANFPLLMKREVSQAMRTGITDTVINAVLKCRTTIIKNRYFP